MSQYIFKVFRSIQTPNMNGRDMIFSQSEHPVPYTPQQNGVDERKNRSLKDISSCMMESKTLPPKFWDEAIKCAS